jgi:hypothetical protein
MSHVSGNGPEVNKPQETSLLAGFLGGCASLVLLIIVGIGGWDYWQAGIEREAQQKVDRWIRSMQQEQQRIWQQNPPPNPLFEQQKRIGELSQMLQELQRYRNRR